MTDVEPMDLNDDYGGITEARNHEDMSEQESWGEVEKLCGDLMAIARIGGRFGTSEQQKLAAHSIVQTIGRKIPQTSPMESDIPQLLLELREGLPRPSSSSTSMDSSFQQQQSAPQRQSFSTRRELVEKYAEDKLRGYASSSSPMSPSPSSPMVVSMASSPSAAASVAMAEAQGTGQLACSFCGTTTSPEWRKGPKGPKTLCNACGLVWSKMVKTRKVRKNI